MILKFYFKSYYNLPLGIYAVEYNDLYLLKTDITEILWCFEEYIYLVEVDLNDSGTTFRKCIQEGFICNKFNILKKYSLLNISTYNNIGIKKVIVDPYVFEDNKFINFIHMLNESNIELYFSSWFMCNASANGYVNLLDLYFIYGNKISYNENAMDFASQNGNIKSLDWWLNSGLELKYSDKSFDYLLRNEEFIINTLNWWFESGLEIKYSEEFIKKLSKDRYIRALDLLLLRGFKIICEEIIIDCASSYGHNEVLDWWLNSGVKLNYTEKSIDSAISYRNIKILRWWINSGLKLKYTKAFVIGSREWLKEIGVFDDLIN
ncbi:ankyrin repeat protein [Acanthamoeba polyphaga moumouvirus]|uniref:Ankyrin repeat protein n=2 Tax=Moumouvirus TaxID=3080801 RepID=L7RGF3_9VIRU|nr:ankyrin repeat protein [Acanthamoeba polyphaga moumouvirus]AEX62545.1 putative ankyrin repeat protein [Moumouvirus Monve]AGC02135.1 ankyrin repeat protein [Acanthamoeba polyphaga moumouvirus]AQN68508.1 ankyrin repeat protein [Saudi moumouvirus]